MEVEPFLLDLPLEEPMDQIQFLQVLQQLQQQVVEPEEVHNLLFNKEQMEDLVVEDQDILTPRVQEEQVIPLL